MRPWNAVPPPKIIMIEKKTLMCSFLFPWSNASCSKGQHCYFCVYRYQYSNCAIWYFIVSHSNLAVFLPLLCWHWWHKMTDNISLGQYKYLNKVLYMCKACYVFGLGLQMYTKHKMIVYMSYFIMRQFYQWISIQECFFFFFPFFFVFVFFVLFCFFKF